MTNAKPVSVLGILFAGFLFAQEQVGPPSSPEQDRPVQQEPVQKKTERGPGHEIGSGAGNIGTGAAKGAGNLAKGTGKGVVDLATLHPINAAGSVGKGAAAAGKDVGVGTVKGTGKMAHGIGRAVKKLF